MQPKIKIVKKTPTVTVDKLTTEERLKYLPKEDYYEKKKRNQPIYVDPKTNKRVKSNGESF